MLLLLVISFLCLATAAFVVGELVSLPARQRALSLRRATSFGRQTRPEEVGARERLFVPLAERLAQAMLRLHPKSTVDAIDRRLIAAGLARTLTPQGFLALRAVAAGAGFLVGIVLGAVSGRPAMTLFLACVVGGIGYVVPGFALGRKVRTRSDRIGADLPNALDLLAVSVEAGLGFDGAVVRITERMHGPLADEFSLVLGEMRIGESREQALRNMAERVESQELASFCRAIIQADHLGTSLGKILRVQAVDSRNRRQAIVEEKAAKTPVKMIFPIAIFIFPALFIVALGAAFLNLGQYFDL